jgi:hypothetical protein
VKEEEIEIEIDAGAGPEAEAETGRDLSTDLDQDPGVGEQIRCVKKNMKSVPHMYRFEFKMIWF